MKKLKLSTVDELLVDVVEYAFIEWLIRRKAYVAFQANYDRFAETRKPFRECLREHIRYLYTNPSLGPGSLISSAFLFTEAPEGYQYWLRHSAAWARFFASLLKTR